MKKKVPADVLRKAKENLEYARMMARLSVRSCSRAVQRAEELEKKYFELLNGSNGKENTAQDQHQVS